MFKIMRFTNRFQLIQSLCVVSSFFVMAQSAGAQACFDIMRFQDGVFPSAIYAGTEDATIKGASAAVNFGAADPMQIDGANGGLPESTLIRWDISSLPAGATIEAATILVTVNNQSNAAYEIYEALRPWVEGTVTWNEFDTAMAWTTAGANGAGTDRDSTVLGVTPDDNINRKLRAIVLNASGIGVVQDWLDGVRTNNGFLLRGDLGIGTNGLNLESSEDPVLALRPMLTVFYTMGGSCSPFTCIAVADGGNRTVSMSSIGVFTDIGAAGVTDIEAIAVALDGTTVYAADADQLGTINTGTGLFSSIGSGFGIAGGSLGDTDLTDVDSLGFDPRSNIFYGVHRRLGDSEEDLLFQIDTTTGAHVPDAFGAGIDYVAVGLLDLGGGVVLDDIDDIAVDPVDGQMYGVANESPNGDGDHLLRIDKTSGAVTDVGAMRYTNGDPVEDVEGMGFYNDGSFFVSTGDLSSPNQYRDAFWSLDEATGIVIPLSGFRDTYDDYESLDCLVAGANTLSGKVFIDDNTDGVFNGSDSGIPDITVFIYIDENNDGMVDGGDTLIQTLVTDGSGDYTATLGIEGNFVIAIDTGDPDFPMGMPGGLTTDNMEEADFTGFGNSDPGNDFGWNASVPVELMSFSIE